MLRLFFYTILTFHHHFHGLSLTASSPGQESSPWLIGCTSNASLLGLYEPKDARDLDPVTCSLRCLEERYMFAALSSEKCYCGNKLHCLVIRDCFNTCNERTKDVSGGGERQSSLYLPRGKGPEGNMAVYRTKGPFLHNISLSVSSERRQTEKIFVLEVAGNLAGHPSQPTGIVGLKGRDFSCVTVEFLGTTSEGQSSHHVSVLDNGSFGVTTVLGFKPPGEYEINVRVSNPLSTISSTLQLYSLQHSPGSLMIALLLSPLSVTSCCPIVHCNTNITTKAAHEGDPVSLQAFVRESLVTKCSWWCTHKETLKNTAASLSGSDCLNSIEVITCSILSESVSEDQLCGGHGVSVDMELFLTMKQKNADYNHSCETQTAFRSEGNRDITHDQKVTFSHHHPHIHILHTFNHSSCHLQLCLHCQLPSTAGLPTGSTTDKMCVLRPSRNWTSVVSTNTEFSLDIASHASCTGSKNWIVSLDDATVLNRTTEEWRIDVSLPKAGCYTITLQIFNTVSWASFQTQILAQDPVRDLVLDVPSGVTTNQKHLVFFSVTAGSGVTVSLFVNTTLMYRNSSYTTGAEETVVLFFNHTGTVVIELRAENQVSSQNKSLTVCVEGNRKPLPQAKMNLTRQPHTSQSHIHTDNQVRIYTAEQTYPTNTDITFVALADVPDPVETIWYFGDTRSDRTSSRTITKKYHNPGSFDVVMVMSHNQMSITSDVLTLLIQKKVKLNRLVHQTSVLQNQTVTVSCRVNAGTNVTFLWSFGDGTIRPGQNTEQHVFNRTGEFIIGVVVSNLVSSATLSSNIFVVDWPCQPPAVKNMGPLKLQVQRGKIIHLGVTYETEVDCDISGGLHYAWTLFDSAGQRIPLPDTDTGRQSLTLQSHFLQYDTYTATARVQIINSVVYSNYSVKVQVMPSPPVAFIQGGTNVFITNTSTTMVTLDGQASYDPDFPMNQLSYSWTCTPVSSITSSCFNQHILTSSPLFKFPASFLKHNFDQFQFTLTIHSGERSASSDTFLTVTPSLLRKVLVYCHQCQGDYVNWDQSFTVSAVCEDCNVQVKHIEYTWSLYLVNASSKSVTDVPFCYTVDLRAPSAIVESPATSPQTPEMSAQHPLIVNPSQQTYTVHTSNHPFLKEYGPETKPEERNHGQNDNRAQSNTINKAGPSEPSSSSLVLDNRGDQSDTFGEFPLEHDSSADWEFYFPFLESGDAGGRADYDDAYPSAEEGDPGMSAGRPTGVDPEGFSAGDSSDEAHEDEGSNLVELKPSVVIREPTLIDLPRDPVDRSLFESYTYSGISSHQLSFRPFSVRPDSRYMLEVIAKSQNLFLGRTQLFLKTNPAPKGMMCQVQPVKGVELHTHFSIFCTSGKEDLMYEYSFSVGGGPRRILYQGRDFQYYFSLPAGDPTDDYKVTIYTEIRSSTYGSATKPCPVIIRVQPSFLRDNSSSSTHHDPDLELSESGLRNLSFLLQLGNSAEIRNYISLLSSILNRLSLDTEANINVQRHMRSVLIHTVCELKNSDQVSIADSICILKDLLDVTNQVTAVSIRQITAYVQTISEQLSQTSAANWNLSDQGTLNSLVNLLSYSLHVTTTCDFTPVIPNSTDFKQVLESVSSTSFHIKHSVPVQLVADVLETASDLIQKYILFHKKHEHRVSSSLISLYVTHQNQTSTVIHSGSATFYIPASLVQMLLFQHSKEKRQHKPCVLTVATEVTSNAYTCANYNTHMSGPVVDLSLYKCSTRRKIHIRPLIQPINIEFQHLQRNKTSLHEYILLHNQIHYHSFNITQEHLQQAIQLTIVFTPSSNKLFPIMLLFRMFERPTPSMHHLHQIHRWESNTAHITLFPSYLNAAGVGHFALLNADFNKASRHKHWSEKVSYSLTVDTSLCVSWDGQQGAWTHHGCRTQQTDRNPTVNCSCHQLRPLTVVQHHIQTSYNSADLDLFLSVSSDLTVLGVLMVCVCLYIPALVLCKRADVRSQKSHRAHYLSDNSPFDPYLYVVTIHTGLCSASYMTAKVYIVLYGEDGSSQTKELHAPGFTLFRRNSQDTFILSSAENLGPVWGVHIWHDNSGPSSDWYIKLVEVSEVKRGHVKGCSWLFVAQCWLAVNKDGCHVEKMLRVFTGGIGFAKMLSLKLLDYLSDHHLWISVHSHPSPNSFTHAQRLSVCLLLLSGYACVSALIISQSDDQLQVEFGIIDVSPASVKTGFLSVVAVLPIATVISVLFRLRGVQHAKCRMTEKENVEDALSVSSVFNPPLLWSGFQQWAHDVWRKKQEDSDDLSVFSTILSTDKEPAMQPDVVMQKEDDLIFKSSLASEHQRRNADYALSERNRHQEAFLSNEGQVIQREKDGDVHNITIQSADNLTSQCCHRLAWALCLLLSLSCLVMSVFLGMRFSSSKVLMWTHSLLISLMLCIFLIQPTLIFTVAVIVSCWYRKRADFHCSYNKRELDKKILKHWGADGEQFRHTAFGIEKQLGARQRARFLHLVRPPTQAELRKSHGKKRREAVIYKTLRDFSLCVSMLVLMICITCSSSSTDNYLYKTVRQQFLRNHNNAFMAIQKHEDWWTWTQTSLLDLLYSNSSDKTEQSHVVIGDLVLQKTEMADTFQNQVSMETRQKSCYHMDCYSDRSATVVLGRTKSGAALKLNSLHSHGWVGRRTVALKVQFTLYSPAPNLFTTVALLTKQCPTGVLLPSATIVSVRVYHTPTVWDYVVMVCQLLFLFLSLLLLCHQVSNIAQQGLMGYWRTPCNWVEVSLLTVTLVYYISSIYRFIVIMEVVELLHRLNSGGHVDVTQLATWEQFIRTLHGFILFYLTMKCVTVLRVNRTLSTLFNHSLSSLLWPMISGLIMLVALSTVRNLLHIQSSLGFSSVPCSLQTLLSHYGGLRAARGFPHHFCGFLHLSSTAVWTAVVFSVMSKLIRRAKRYQRRRNVFTFTELAVYIRQRVSEFTGQQRQTWNHVEERTYYFEEFESLLDELLFRLNALSDSLHHTLPPKDHRYIKEDSPINMDTQASEWMEDCPTDVRDYSRRTNRLIPHICSSQPGQQILQQRDHIRHNPSDIILVPSDHLRGDDCSESATLKWILTTDVNSQQANQQAKKNNRCRTAKTQENCKEVVVSVLVHKELGSR